MANACTMRPAISTSLAPRPAAAARVAADAGGRRTSRAAGSSRAQARTPIASIAVRQSWVVISQRANGEIVIGATPIPAETSETARLRLVSNHAVVAAI